MADATANLSVVLSMNDQASSKMQTFGRATDTVNKSTLETRRSFRELTMGMTIVGTGLLGLSGYLKQTNDQFLKTTGNILGFAGAGMVAVGSAAHLVVGIVDLIRVMNSLRTASLAAAATEALATAGPLALPALAVAGVAAGGFML